MRLAGQILEGSTSGYYVSAGSCNAWQLRELESGGGGWWGSWHVNPYAFTSGGGSLDSSDTSAIWDSGGAGARYWVTMETDQDEYLSGYDTGYYSTLMYGAPSGSALEYLFCDVHDSDNEALPADDFYSTSNTAALNYVWGSDVTNGTNTCYAPTSEDSDFDWQTYCTLGAGFCTDFPPILWFSNPDVALGNTNYAAREAMGIILSEAGTNSAEIGECGLVTDSVDYPFYSKEAAMAGVASMTICGLPYTYWIFEDFIPGDTTTDMSEVSAVATFVQDNSF